MGHFFVVFINLSLNEGASKVFCFTQLLWQPIKFRACVNVWTNQHRVKNGCYQSLFREKRNRGALHTIMIIFWNRTTKSWKLYEQPRMKCRGLKVCKQWKNEETITDYVWLFLFTDKPVETKLIVSSGSRKVVVNGTLILNCTTLAVPPATEFRFYRNDSNIENATKGILTINNISSSEAGQYRCTPWNKMGKGQSASVSITILGNFISI
jgi:hypothetical protein